MNTVVMIPETDEVNAENIGVMHYWMHAVVTTLKEDADRCDPQVTSRIREIYGRRMGIVDEAVEGRDFVGLTEVLKDLAEGVCDLSEEGREVLSKRIAYSAAFDGFPMKKAICD